MANTVSVAFGPPTNNELVVVVTVKVDPVIRTGICELLPLAVATIVAVRVLALLVPAEKVTVALPDASLTVLDALRKPLSAENVTGTPDTAALEVLTTVAVIVAELLLSDATEVRDELTLIAEADGVGGGGVVGVVVVPEPPPPHALNTVATNHKPTNVLTFDEILITRTPTAS